MNKKKLLLACLATACVLHTGTFATMAESTQEVANEEATATEEISISFRDIPWYAKKPEVEGIMADAGASIEYAAFKDNILRMSGIDYTNTTSGKDRVDNGGVVGSYPGLSVAGYQVSSTGACYIYDLNEDGTINRDENLAEFYFGWYTFDSNDFVDGIAVYEDLGVKLSSIYGEGVVDDTSEFNTTTTWKDPEGNQIRLLLGGKYKKENYYVTLGYMAAGADERLDEMQIAIDNEAAAAQAAEMAKNASNTDGL